MADQIIQLHLATQQYMGFKIETDRGTAETLADADFKFLVSNLKAKITIAENQRQAYAVGDPYPFQSVMGKRMMELSGTLDVQGSGNVSNDPAHFTMLLAAGFAALTPSVNYRGQNLTLPNKTATIEVQEKENVGTSIRGKKYKMKGSGATKLTEHYDGSGQLQKIDFTYIGAFVGTTDLTAGSNNVPSLVADATVPPAALGVTTTFAGFSLAHNGFTVDYAPKCALLEDPRDATGYAFCIISRFDPVVQIKVLVQLEATLGIYAALTAGSPTLGAFIAIIGTGTNQIEINIPNAQIVKGLDLDQRDGVDEQALILRAIRNTTAVHTFTIPLVGRFMPIT